MLSPLSSSPAVPGESQEHCCNNKFISTIHRADGVGVKLYNPTPQCTHTETQTPSETLQKPLSELRRKVKNNKGQSCWWMCWEETLLCHYIVWQLLFDSDEVFVASGMTGGGVWLRRVCLAFLHFYVLLAC